MYRILWLREHGPISYSFPSLKFPSLKYHYNYSVINPINYNVINPRNYNVIFRKNYSLATNGQPNESLIPVVIYPNAFLDKPVILKNAKNKVGIYRWVNKVNGNT
jgi:hypothetical protein